MKSKSFLQTIPGLLICAGICCFLWGSAIAVIKVGYDLLDISKNATGDMLVFAGIRFTIAGIMAVIAGSFVEKKLLIPKRGDWHYILPVGLFQTILQYMLYYPALAHCEGVTASVIIAAGTFFSVLLAGFLFRTEKPTTKKLLGCLIGLAGILIINLADGAAFSFSFYGEGLILISVIAAAFSSNLVSIYGKVSNPALISGWQFVYGGIVITIGGYLMGGHAKPFSPVNIGITLYLAFVSAVAYTLWSYLLRVNTVSRVMVFNFLTPVFGVLCSAVLLGEWHQAFNVRTLVALILVSIGIVQVNRAQS